MTLSIICPISVKFSHIASVIFALHRLHLFHTLLAKTTKMMPNFYCACLVHWITRNSVSPVAADFWGYDDLCADRLPPGQLRNFRGYLIFDHDRQLAGGQARSLAFLRCRTNNFNHTQSCVVQNAASVGELSCRIGKLFRWSCLATCNNHKRHMCDPWLQSVVSWRMPWSGRWGRFDTS